MSFERSYDLTKKAGDPGSKHSFFIKAVEQNGANVAHVVRS